MAGDRHGGAVAIFIQHRPLLQLWASSPTKLTIRPSGGSLLWAGRLPDSLGQTVQNS